MLSTYTLVGGQMIDGVLLLNGTADFNGTANALILDNDGDTSIGASVNNEIDVKIGGALDFTLTSNTLNVLAGSLIAGPSSTFVPFIPIATQQSMTDNVATNITTYNTLWTTTGAATSTLADGIVKGQLKKILMVAHGGNGVLTPANLTTYTTITFTAIGSYALLCWKDSAWVILESFGCTLA